MAEGTKNTEISEADLEVFQFIQDLTAKVAANDYAGCWAWPTSWPEDWPVLRKGYSVSRNGDGYGQFRFPGASRSEMAHILSFELAHRVTTNMLTEDIPEVAEVGIQNNSSLVPGRVQDGGDTVRHAECCKSGAKEACINPLHLRKGSNYYNLLDKELTRIRNCDIGPKAKKLIPEVLRLWFPPGGYNVLAKHLGIANWEVVSILLHNAPRPKSISDTESFLQYLLTDIEPR